MMARASRKIAALLIVGVLALSGCAAKTADGKFDTSIAAKHLLNDLVCFQAATKYAAVIVGNGGAALIGIPAGVTVDAEAVLTALSQGGAVNAPIDLLLKCEGALHNIEDDLAAGKNKPAEPLKPQ